MGLMVHPVLWKGELANSRYAANANGSHLLHGCSSPRGMPGAPPPAVVPLSWTSSSAKGKQRSRGLCQPHLEQAWRAGVHQTNRSQAALVHRQEQAKPRLNSFTMFPHLDEQEVGALLARCELQVQRLAVRHQLCCVALRQRHLCSSWRSAVRVVVHVCWLQQWRRSGWAQLPCNLG